MAIYSGFTHWKLWFSILMLVYQRVHTPSIHIYPQQQWSFCRSINQIYKYIYRIRIGIWNLIYLKGISKGNEATQLTPNLDDRRSAGPAVGLSHQPGARPKTHWAPWLSMGISCMGIYHMDMIWCKKMGYNTDTTFIYIYIYIPIVVGCQWRYNQQK